MRLKRLSALVAAVFFLLTAFTSIAYADNFPGTNTPSGTDYSSVISDAETNYGISPQNKPGAATSQQYPLACMLPPPELQVPVTYQKNGTAYNVHAQYGYLYYDHPHGDFDTTAGRHRYVGYTYEGDDYTNLAWPPDATPNGQDFETQDWIQRPWLPGSQAQAAMSVTKTPWEEQTSFTDPKNGDQLSKNLLLMAGMSNLNKTTGVGGTYGVDGCTTHNGYTFNLGDGNTIWQNLCLDADIMMPPTDTTWGMARMFHMYNGYPYYIDIPIPPMDLVEGAPFLDVEPPSATINVGDVKWFHDYYFSNQNAQPVDVTTSSNWTDDNTAVATIGANTGGAKGISPGTTNITATYTDSNGITLTGTAVLNVQQAQDVLAVTPASATINVGGTQKYTAMYYQDSQDAINGTKGTDVTQASQWSSSNISIAVPTSTPGVFKGVSPSTVTVTATYTPAGSTTSLTGTATLTVTGQQPQPPGGSGSGTLIFQAVNQANAETIFGRKFGGTLQRGPDIALWDDTVTATLSYGQPPAPAPLPLNGYTFLGFTDWNIADATLTYPAQNPQYSYGNPVEPVGNVAPASMTAEKSGPSATIATAQFTENWSEDGIGYNSTAGCTGVKDNLEGSPYCGQIVAKSPKSYSPMATYTVNYGYTYKYITGYDPVTGDPIWSNPIAASGSTGTQTTTGTLWVCGAGCTPITGSGGKVAIIGSTLNPQTHP